MAMAMAVALALSFLVVQCSFKEAIASSSSSVSSSSRQKGVGSPGISSNSILVALLDSQHTEFSELVEKASLLQALEEVLSVRNVTILAPRNGFLDAADPDFRRFLLEPRNLASLQRLLRFHMVPRRIAAEQWRTGDFSTLVSSPPEPVRLGPATATGKLRAGLSDVVKSDAIVRPDGIVHTVDRLLIPNSVSSAYSTWKYGAESLAVKPEAAPSLDSAYRASKSSSKSSAPSPSPTNYFFSYNALAPAPGLSPAPAPGPSSGRRWFNGDAFVADFIYTLVHYGGYNEIADLLVNLTSLAPELSKLVSEGYRITVLAPNDEAMGKLTAEHLAGPGAPEQIIYHHILPEYQTEESFYNSVRKFGRVTYETLLVPHKIVAQESDGAVKFGTTGDEANLYDHDIYIDGRISVQGIDKVLLPAGDTTATSTQDKANGRSLYEEEDIFDDDTDEDSDKADSQRGGLFSAVLCKLGLSRHPSCQ